MKNMKRSLIILLLLLAPTVSAQGKVPNLNYTTGGSITSIDSYHNDVVVGSQDSHIYFISGTYLKEKWRYDAGDQINSVAISDRYVVTASMDGTIHVLDHNKTEVWKSQLNSYVDRSDAVSLSNENILVGTRNGWVYFYDIDGELEFNITTDAYILAASIPEDFIIVVSDKKVYILDKNGNLLTQRAFQSYIRSAHISDNNIVIGLGNNQLLLLNKTGKEAWRKNLSDQIGTVYAYENKIGAGCRDRNFYLFDANGNLKWQTTLSESVVEVAMDEDNIAVASLNGNIHLFDTNGMEKWRFSEERGAPVLHFLSRAVVVGAPSGELYFFRLNKGSIGIYFVGAVIIAVIIFGLSIVIRNTL